MKRTVIPELLDADQGTSEEVAGSLADLRLINRWFGGIETTRAMVAHVASRTGCRELSMLDVGSGSGDIPVQTAERLRPRGITFRSTVLLDRAASHLPEQDFVFHVVAGDALALPFRDGSFEVVTCALLVHHLEPEEVVRFVDEGLRVARIAVLINDLRRSWAHLAAAYAGFPLYRSRLTRHDGPASVRRAYTREELMNILRRTSAQQVEIGDHYLFRMGAIAWKQHFGI